MFTQGSNNYKNNNSQIISYRVQIIENITILKAKNFMFRFVPSQIMFREKDITKSDRDLLQNHKNLMIGICIMIRLTLV